MRRLISVLILALLPLQIGWATVASYCGHESDRAAQHFGHHEHEHHADSGHAAEFDGSKGSGDTGANLFGTSDGDCSTCHLHLADAIFLITAPLAGTHALSPPPQPEYRPHAVPTTPPERPQWQRLA